MSKLNEFLPARDLFTVVVVGPWTGKRTRWERPFLRQKPTQKLFSVSTTQCQRSKSWRSLFVILLKQVTAMLVIWLIKSRIIFPTRFKREIKFSSFADAGHILRYTNVNGQIKVYNSQNMCTPFMLNLLHCIAFAYHKYWYTFTACFTRARSSFLSLTN